jgi:hypothetical protein
VDRVVVVMRRREDDHVDTNMIIMVMLTVAK